MRLYSQTSGSSWWTQLEPFVLPILKLVGPIALRAILTWWLTKRRRQSLTRRQKVLIWAVALGVHVPKSGPLKRLYSSVPP